MNTVVRLSLLLVGGGAAFLLVVNQSVEQAAQDGYVAGVEIAAITTLCTGWVACAYAALAFVERRRLSFIMECGALLFAAILIGSWLYIWLTNATYSM